MVYVMKSLKPHNDLGTFFQTLKMAEKRVLLLDYDGTLAPFRVEREKAVPYVGVEETLDHIIASGRTRVVIITGRAIKDLAKLFVLKKQPEIWGSHGWERLLPDGCYKIEPINGELLAGLAEAKEWIEQKKMQDHIEEKPASLALHWRGLSGPSIRQIHNDVEKKWLAIADKTLLSLHEFDGGLELRVQGRNKGDAVETIMAETGTQAVVAYLGDDLTDEDAFTTLGTRGLSILVRKELRPTAADIWLKPPEELLLFLRSWMEACREN
jgi:trehalose-phosphatase